MPAKHRQIDPMTGDYTVERGSPVADATAASLIVLRLRMRRGTFPLLPNFGSRLHTLTKVIPGVERRAVDFVFEAIADLIKRRVVREVTVAAEVSGSQLLIEVAFKDTDDDERSVRYTHRVGS
jgi:phage gp46-like protein